MSTAAFVLGLVATFSPQDYDFVVRGGRLFDGLGDELVENEGIVIRGGKILTVGVGEVEGGHLLELDDDLTIVPGFFDLHAHYAIDLFGAGRVDDTEVYPRLFLGNGVTSTFPAGEVDPEEMRELRMRIDRDEAIGPRIYNSGPYFGRWRRGWRRSTTASEVRAEVDHWAELGVRGFKAKGLGPTLLPVLIERAHLHGLTVTGHLGSGWNGSVNPRDAIAMGIDRVEHFLGGDAMPADVSSYESLEKLDPDTPEFARIAKLFIDHGVYFDATLTAYGYFGEREEQVFGDFADERAYFTPYVQELVAKRGKRPVNEQFERIYHVKRKTIKAFYDAGGGHLITLGTDHPSWGEYVSGFAVHRELHAFVLAGIPPADTLRIATINGARALGVGDQLGTIEAGKLADLVVIRGDPLADIRATRDVRMVVKAGKLYAAPALLGSVKGKLGPAGPEEDEEWMPRDR